LRRSTVRLETRPQDDRSPEIMEIVSRNR